MQQNPTSYTQSEKRIAVFFTGGTIGMKHDAGHGVVPGIDLENLIGRAAEYLDGQIIHPVQWANLPSPHMTPELMFKLAKDIDHVLADSSVVGAVVTHGTDVMEESAFMADLVINSDKPVVFTGSMRHSGEAGYDGVRNLLSAIKAASKPALGAAGVVVLMTDRIFSAAEVTKVHSMGIDSFDAPGSGPIGYIVGDNIHLYRSPVRRRVVNTAGIEKHVDLITFSPGMDAHFIDCAMQYGAKGLIVEGFGAGNIPPGAYDGILRAVEEGIPVVLTSRCIEGGVWPIYGYKGGAAELKERGVIMGGSLSSQKARILLMAALGETRDIASIATYFAHSVL